ncbi:hypothetical protein [Rhabdochromatium marinum]|uniref:hypothetical protein n=1 Tax=Rhabdochromatium marinum TaxID=48729 RepID=UPI001903A4BE|nr:hypothetical protein [Rhabdochromatium marinum]
MRLPSLNLKSRALQRLPIGYANEVRPSTQGRVLLTIKQREYAQCETTISSSGVVIPHER